MQQEYQKYCYYLSLPLSGIRSMRLLVHPALSVSTCPSIHSSDHPSVRVHPSLPVPSIHSKQMPVRPSVCLPLFLGGSGRMREWGCLLVGVVRVGNS